MVENPEVGDVHSSIFTNKVSVLGEGDHRNDTENGEQG